jgi:hypothetical protein
LWDLGPTPPTLSSTVDVAAGAFTLAGLPARWATIVRRPAAGDVTGPDFRSQAVAQPPADGSAAARVDVTLSEPQQLTQAALNGWLASVLAAPPGRFELPGATGWAEVANLAGAVGLTAGELELGLTGSLTYAVAGTQGAGEFTATAKVALSPSNAPASTDLVDVHLIGAPDIVTSIPGPLSGLVVPLISGWLGASVVQQFAAAAQQRLPALIVAALGVAAVPEDATLSVPSLAVSSDAVTYQAAMGSLTAESDVPKPGAPPRLLWTQRQDIGPSPRADHAMAYDAGAQRVLLFGGAAQGQPLGDTWEWDGRYWTQAQDVGPHARSGHALAFDTARARAILFGGAGAGVTERGDTWAWDGAYWTQIADTGPAPRALHACAYDPVRMRLVVFGGATAGTRHADTWEWDGAAWTQLHDSGPAARERHAMGYDETHGTVVLFGGTGDHGDLGDTWEWDGEDWTEVEDVGPDPRYGHALCATPTAIMVHGGRRGGDPLAAYADSWLWRDARWTKVQDMGPAPRWGHAAAYDATRACAVLYGGSDADGAGRLGDTWETGELG